MSFEQFPRLLTIRVLENNDKANMGTFNFTESVELSNMVLTMFKNGAGEGGSERFRINIYTSTDTARASVLFQSSFFTWSDASAGEFFLTTIRFDFAGEQLRSGKSYIMELEAQNYTRNADVFYFSYVLDHPAQLNERTVSNKAGAQLAILGRII